MTNLLPQIKNAVSNLTEKAETEKKSAKVWLNLVVPTGEVDDNGEPIYQKIVTYGLALDTMPLGKVTNSKSSFNQMVRNTNSYQTQLVEAGMSLEPGSSIILNPNVRVQLYRSNDEVEQTNEDNAHLINLF